MLIEDNYIKTLFKNESVPGIKLIFIRFFTDCLESGWDNWQSVPKEAKDELNLQLSHVMTESISKIVTSIVDKEVNRILSTPEDTVDGI